MKNRMLFPAIMIVMLCACKKDDSPVSTVPGTVDYSQDYFPYSNSYVWTYNTNALSDSGKNYSSFQMKLDTHQFRKGQFMSIKLRIDSVSQWGAMYGIKDSAGTVYILGDNPPEIAFPLFKHSFAPGEGVAETITVNGISYPSVRYPVNLGPGDTLFLWLSKGIGLVKEMSNQGQSIFSDNNSSRKVHIETVLTKVAK
ncbi:MAG: hypothetical protein ACOYNS_17310 [Bacteroidota bacterium]